MAAKKIHKIRNKFWPYNFSLIIVAMSLMYLSEYINGPKELTIEQQVI